MSKQKYLNLLGQGLLVLAAFAWGTSFLILKNTIDTTPAIYVVGVRFLIASVILGLVFIKKIVKIDKDTLKHGILLGVVLFFAYTLQTLGLKFTTPSRNAFITSSYCVMCPFVIWILYKKRPKSYHIVSALLCIIGVGLVALTNDSGGEGSLLLGDLLTLSCALFYALQIIFIDKFNKKYDAILLVITEMFVAGVLLLIFTFCFELPVYGIENYKVSLDTLFNIIYLTVVCTLMTQLCQMIGQRFATPSQVSIILSFEAVFGAIFSVLVGDEKLTVSLIIGFTVIFIAMIISELKPDLLKPFRKKVKVENEEIKEKDK